MTPENLAFEAVMLVQLPEEYFVVVIDTLDNFQWVELPELKPEDWILDNFQWVELPEPTPEEWMDRDQSFQLNITHETVMKMRLQSNQTL